MKVYLVGVRNFESTDVSHVCLSKTMALKLWEGIRKDLIVRNQKLWDLYGHAIYMRTNTNLKETDPEKMDNHPLDEPFIHEMETAD